MRWKSSTKRLKGPALVVIAALALSMTAPMAANARTTPDRSSLPIVVGSQLWGKWSGQDCTAGVVLKKTGAHAFFSPRERGARYVVMAKHCFRRVTEPVIMYLHGGHTEIEVGQVKAFADPDDLALVRIEGVRHNFHHCGGGSGGHQCTVSFSFTPRAFNKVLLPGFGPGHETTLPMVSQGVPAPQERFCTGGAITLSMCIWTSTAVPGEWVPNQVYAAGISDNGDNLLKGDSGGPVMSRTGTFYGIATDSGRYSTNHQNHDIMGYTDAARVLQDFPGYVMAPAG